MIQMTTTYKLIKDFRTWLNYNRTASKVKAMLESLEPNETKNNLTIYLLQHGDIRIEVGHHTIPKNTKYFELIDFFADKKGSQPMTKGIAIYSKKARV